MKNYLRVIVSTLRSRDAQIVAWCAGVVALWRVSLELLNHAIVPFMGTMNHSIPTHFFAPSFLRWINYDAAWYLNIIRNGYIIGHHLHGQETIAFFPVYPELVRLLSAIFHTPEIGTGVVLNIILSVISAFYVYKLTVLMAEKAKKKNGELLAKFAVMLFIMNPASFFFASLYADAILVLCMTAATYYALKNSFYIAALFAGVAAGTKSIGIVLLPVLAVMYAQANWEDIKKWKVIATKHVPRLIAIGLLSTSGMLAYMIYLWHRFGDPLAFVKIEKYWGRSPSLMAAAHSIWNQYVAVAHGHDRLFSISLCSIYLCAIPIAFALFGLYLLIRHRWQYVWLVLLCALVIAMPLSTGQLGSLNRYILGLTPAMAYVAVYVYSNKYLKPLAISFVWLSAVLLVIFSTSFLAGYFMG